MERLQDVKIESANFTIEGKVDSCLLNIGGMYLNHDGRTASIDPMKSWFTYDEDLDITLVEMVVQSFAEAMEDDTWVDEPFSLRVDDLNHCEVELYLTTEESGDETCEEDYVSYELDYGEIIFILPNEFFLERSKRPITQEA